MQLCCDRKDQNPRNTNCIVYIINIICFKHCNDQCYSISYKTVNEYVCNENENENERENENELYWPGMITHTRNLS